MTPERWKQVENLFYLALDCPPLDRKDWLTSVCEDESVNLEVLELFSYHEHHAMVDRPLQWLSNVPTTLSNLIGTTLDGKYCITKHLGQGGMGSVFQGTHLGTDRLVAVKVITPEFTAQAEFVERFKREAKAAGRLHHPNIVNVTDFGITHHEGQPVAYLVMEYLDGFTLGSLLKEKGPLSLEPTLDILEQTALAIDAAHDQGIIHRDLKPENIWLEPNGRGGYAVKVLDFGLAKFQETNPEPSPRYRLGVESGMVDKRQVGRQRVLASGRLGEEKTQLFETSTTNGQDCAKTEGAGITRAGAVMGTPLYMSPEQCQGSPLDASSDIYSLGVIAYQMLAGEPPFAGNMVQVLADHVGTSPQPLWMRCREIPIPVGKQVMQALAKDPSQRPQTAAAYIAGLRIHSAGEDSLRQEARTLFQQYFANFIKLTLVTHAPFMVLNCLLTVVLMQHWAFDFPLASGVQFGCWVLLLFSVILSFEAGTSACTVAIDHLRRSFKSGFEVRPVLNQANRHYLSGLSLPILGKFGLGSLLAGPAAVIENLQGTQAVERSQTLVNRLRSWARSLQLRQLNVGLATLMAFQVSFTVANQLLLQADLDPVFRMTMVFLVVCSVAVVFATLVYPRLELFRSLLYFKAREVGGEWVGENRGPRMTTMLTVKRGWKTHLRKAKLVAGALVLLLGVNVNYILLVPPVGKFPKPPEFQVAAVADKDNGWKEYKTATRILGLTAKEVMDFPKGLLKYSGFETQEFPEDAKLFLDSNQEALAHFLTATKYPRIQFPQDAKKDGFENEQLDFLVVRGPSILAVGQSRRLADSGKMRESAEMALAAYRLGTEFSHSDGTLISVFASIAIRGTAARGLLNWHQKGGADAQTEIEMVKQLAELGKQIPTPNETMKSEFEWSKRTAWKRMFENPNSEAAVTQSKLWMFLPGLKMRMYQGWSKSLDAISEAMHPTLETWDLANGDEVQKRVVVSSRPWYEKTTVGDLLGDGMAHQALPSFMALTRSLYRDQELNGALQILIACDAYQKLYGEFPERLEPAMKKLGLTVPIDPVTGRTVGYRLENGQPLLWYAGMDGKDDGGRQDYEVTNGSALKQPGHDIIFRFRQFRGVW